MSQHHSQTLPRMSYRPQALGRLPPTSWIRPPELPRCQAISSSRPYRGPVVPARDAYPPPASVGSRYPSTDASHSMLSMATRYAGAKPSRSDRALQNRTEREGLAPAYRVDIESIEWDA